MRTKMKFLAAGVAAMVLAPNLSMGTVYTIGTSVSSANVDPVAGMTDWWVGGQDQLELQWFWYRVGNTGPEKRINTLPLAGATITDTDGDGSNDTLNLRYTGNGFATQVTYLLTSDHAGLTSDIAETIKITNTGRNPLNFHFYQYVDFNISGTPGDDVAARSNANAIQQGDAGFFSETTATPAPSHWEINTPSALLAKLNNNVANNLSDLNALNGPADAAWAFQWDVDLGSGKSLIISKDKHIQALAVPDTGAAMNLFGLGMSSLLLLGKRRQNKA